MSATPALTSDLRSSRTERWGWYFYDWANSAFITIVVTVFFGPYLTSLAKASADGNGLVWPLGIPVAAGSLFPYLVAVSVVTQVLLLPVVGAAADYSNRKKNLLTLFAFAGAATTISMYALTDGTYLMGCGLFLAANFCFGSSVVVYNAFLPEISSPEERDAVSARGWAFGYLGGGLALLGNLLLFQYATAIGISEALAARISLASAGVWWGLFAMAPALTLKNRDGAHPLPDGHSPLTAGFQQLGRTLRQLPLFPQTLLFLTAYLFFNDGIQTVISLSSQFGQEELHMTLARLAELVLMIQFVAFFGALLFERLARVMGAKRALMLSLAVWALLVIYAYQWLHTENEYFGMGFVLALVLGGSQALARSLFSLMIPEGREAEYFSLYEISDKGTSWLGPLIYGFTYQMTGNFRLALLTLIVLFAAGLGLLSRVNVRLAMDEASHVTTVTS